MTKYNRPREKPYGAFPSVDLDKLEEKLKEGIVEIPGRPKIEERKREIPYGTFPSINTQKIKESLESMIVEIPGLDTSSYRPRYCINLLKENK